MLTAWLGESRGPLVCRHTETSLKGTREVLPKEGCVLFLKEVDMDVLCFCLSPWPLLWVRASWFLAQLNDSPPLTHILNILKVFHLQVLARALLKTNRCASDNYTMTNSINGDRLWQTRMYGQSFYHTLILSCVSWIPSLFLRLNHLRKTESSLRTSLCTHHLISCLAHGRCQWPLLWNYHRA